MRIVYTPNSNKSDISMRVCFNEKLIATNPIWAGNLPYRFTCRSVFGASVANPQSERRGLSSSSSNMFADFKFLWTTEGKHTSCKYLSNKNQFQESIQGDSVFVYKSQFSKLVLD